MGSVLVRHSVATTDTRENDLKGRKDRVAPDFRVLVQGYWALSFWAQSEAEHPGRTYNATEQLSSKQRSRNKKRDEGQDTPF